VGRRISDYTTNRYGEPAEPVRVLAEALGEAGAVVDPPITWVPEGVGRSEHASFASTGRRPPPRLGAGPLLPAG